MEELTLLVMAAFNVTQLQELGYLYHDDVLATTLVHESVLRERLVILDEAGAVHFNVQTPVSNLRVRATNGASRAPVSATAHRGLRTHIPRTPAKAHPHVSILTMAITHQRAQCRTI